MPYLYPIYCLHVLLESLELTGILVMFRTICRNNMFRQAVISKHVEAFKTAIENKIGKVIDAYYILGNYDDIYP